MSKDNSKTSSVDVSLLPVAEVIRQQYDQIFSAERKVADYVLANPQEVIEATVHDLAAASGVSDATVVRMCYHLGYKGYYQFRIMLARDAGSLQTTGSPWDNDSAAFLERSANSIRSMGELLDAKQVKKAVEMIRSCQEAHILAVGNTFPLGLYMSFRLGRLGIRTTSGLSAEYFLNSINLAGENDLIIAISKSGESRQIVQGISLAREKHLPVLAITANPRSPAAKKASCVLLSAGKAGETLPSHHSLLQEFALIDTLLELMTNWDEIIAKGTERPEDILQEYKMS